MVQYGEHPTSKRRQFKWILFQDYGEVVVHIPRSNVSFVIRTADHSTCEPQYLENINRKFFGEGLGACTISRALHPAPSSDENGPIYIRSEERLGSGNSGEVYKLLDVSNGEEYAGKIMYARSPSKEQIRDWKREVDSLRNIQHVGSPQDVYPNTKVNSPRLSLIHI